MKIKSKELENYIKTKVQIDDVELDEILSHFEYRLLKKDKYLKKKAQFFTDYIYVISGHIRVFIIDEKSKEITVWIASEGVFFNDVIASRTNEVTDFYMQCLDDTEIAIIPNKKMEFLYDKFPKWQKFGRLLWEDMTCGISGKIISLLTNSAEKRYLTLLENTDLVNKIPLKQLSSFLGITPSSLSRIRKSISKK